MGQKEHNVQLFSHEQPPHVYVSVQETTAVQIAVNNLINDIEAVLGSKASSSMKLEQCRIVIGTIGNTDIDAIIQQVGVRVDELYAEDGTLRWEAYVQQIINGDLYIIGSDRRGTIYGVYDLSEEIGVSPWYYWGDVPVKKKNTFHISAQHYKADWPSVQYRGIFINDEEELEDWAKLHTSDDTIGPTAYGRIFELLLRLKANYIWPAMHVNYFNENVENARLAESMGIVVGTSHCDMLLRSNQNEWEPWIASKGYHDAIYDYSIEGKNREILKQYWRESVEQYKDNEVSYTVGMRGIHDSGFHTAAIDADDSKTAEEKQQARVQLLSQVINDQREILREVLGEDKAKTALQTFIPYKEVLVLYDQQLDVPEDVTLIWANDNFGHVRRYPNEAERARSGGNGLYFHNSYWAAPGTAMSYLFINSIPLAHTGNELKKSYESGIRKLWILNIGGLKPLEQDMEFFLRYGWEAGKAAGVTKDTTVFTEQWINRNFSGELGREAAQLYEIFAQVTNVRKIEHMNSQVFSQTAYGDEAGRRLQQLEDIYRRGNELLYRLPVEEREAFFQLFLMKIHASYYTNHEYYYGDRSVLSYERGNMQAADLYSELAARMTDYKRAMLQYYNKVMSNGKWDGIMTPESFPPPPTAMHPERKPALRIQDGGSIRVDLWNDENSLSFSPYGITEKWFDIGNQGAGSIPFCIEVSQGADWLVVSEIEGILHTDKRITVSVTTPMEHAGKQATIVVRDQKYNKAVIIQVKVEEVTPLPTDFVGFVASDGYVAFPAEQYEVRYTPDSLHGVCEWREIQGIGRYQGSAMMAWHSHLCSLEQAVTDNPYLQYNVYLKDEGDYKLEIHRFLTLNSTGRIRFAIGIDDQAPIILESDTNDEWRGNWQQAVFDNGEKLTLQLPQLASGSHSIKLYMIDHYVTISKLVLYKHPMKISNLGPVTSWHTERGLASYGNQSADVQWEQIEQLCNQFYLTNVQQLELPPVSYTPREFYEHRDHLFFDKCLQVPQQTLGKPRYAELLDANGEKDWISAFGTGAFIEKDGVVAIEAEYALENSQHAFLTAAKNDNEILWTHLQSDTNGKTGLAMHVAAPNLLWDNPAEAPAMHYGMHIQAAGTYRVWLLLRHYNKHSDSCYVALDGKVQPLEEQFGGGRLYTYNTSYIYYWCLFSELEISSGDHILSIIARKSQLRIDRIYLTRGDELPPIDAKWQDAIRG